MRFTAILFLLTTIFGVPLRAVVPAWETDLLKARDHQDRAALQKMISTLDQNAQKTPKDADAQYKVALANSYLGEICLELKDKGAAASAAEAGVRAAQAAIALQPKNAEYYRVLGTLCGQAIPAVNMLSALTYGKRAKEAINKAMELDPNSARVHEAQGVGNYYLPAQLGGGPELAIKDFRKAIELDPKAPDSYLWLGLALRKLHNNGEARQAIQKAIDLDPQRVWLKEQLEKTPAQ
jgi:tetratricopeptide (TPR) repeat protein